MRSAEWLIIAHAVMLAACGAPDRPRAPHTAESGTQAAPLVLIGVEDGAAEYMFDHVYDAGFTQAGEIVVTDRSGTIRLFDSAGALVRSFGRRGSGPGEYRGGPYLVAALPDGWLQFYDDLSRRLTTVSREGAYLASVPVNASGLPAGAADGVLWLANYSISRSGGATVQYSAVATADGRITHSFTVPLPPTEVVESGGMVSMQPPPPWLTPLARSCGPSLCLLLVGSDSILKVSATGARSFAEPVPPAARLGPGHFPTLMSDDNGSLWVKAPATATTAELIPLDNAGSSIVRVPLGFAPLRAERERILGVNTDSLGVQRVEVYPLPHRR